MSTARESNDIRKAMAYELIQIIKSKEQPKDKKYSPDEIEELINKYILVATSNN